MISTFKHEKNVVKPRTWQNLASKVIGQNSLTKSISLIKIFVGDCHQVKVVARMGPRMFYKSFRMKDELISKGPKAFYPQFNHENFDV